MVPEMDCCLGCGDGWDVVVGYWRGGAFGDASRGLVWACSRSSRRLLFFRLEELGSQVRFQMGSVLGFSIRRLGRLPLGVGSLLQYAPPTTMAGVDELVFL